MIVKFATVCDFEYCNNKSNEYTSFPHCMDCGLYFCPDHGTITIEADVDQPEKGYCNSCKEE